MLEDASLSIRALGGVLQEILADRRQILSAQTLLLHEIVLPVGEATPLVLQEVLAVLALEPEPAQLSLDLLFPHGLSEGLVGSEGLCAHEMIASRCFEIFIFRRVQTVATL